MITAMTTFVLVLIAVLFVLSFAEMLREVFADRPAGQPPRSHFEDPTLRSPGAWR